MTSFMPSPAGESAEMEEERRRRRRRRRKRIEERYIKCFCQQFFFFSSF